MHRHQQSSEETTGDAVGELWRAHHRYLLDVAYRMLGSVSEAEDVLQEAFIRLLRADLTEIDDVRGWLVVVVSRLCLDQLRSARSRHEVYVGPWLPEPVIEPVGKDRDPADRVTLNESVRMALLVVLERLTPAERAAFVLHDVFQFSFEAVGEIMGRSPLACRQLASRARRRIQRETSPARFTVDPTELHRVAGQFITASTSGDLDALMQVLDPNVIGHTDTGGLFPGAPLRPITGQLPVARTFLGFLRARQVTLAPMAVNGEPGVVAYQDGQLIAVISLIVKGGLIAQIHSIANPRKLAYVASVLEAGGLPGTDATGTAGRDHIFGQHEGTGPETPSQSL